MSHASEAQAQAPFTISVYPDTIILGTRSGSTGRFIVTVLAGPGFNGTVYLSVSGAPDGVTAIFRDYGAYVTSLATFTTYLEVTSSPAATLGNNTLAISATSQFESFFYAAVSQVGLIIQEHGQTRAGSKSDEQAATSSRYTITLIAALVAGIFIGSLSTYVFVRRKISTRNRTVEDKGDQLLTESFE